MKNKSQLEKKFNKLPSKLTIQYFPKLSYTKEIDYQFRLYKDNDQYIIEYIDPQTENTALFISTKHLEETIDLTLREIKEILSVNYFSIAHK